MARKKHNHIEKCLINYRHRVYLHYHNHFKRNLILLFTVRKHCQVNSLNLTCWRLIYFSFASGTFYLINLTWMPDKSCIVRLVVIKWVIGIGTALLLNFFIPAVIHKLDLNKKRKTKKVLKYPKDFNDSLLHFILLIYIIPWLICLLKQDIFILRQSIHKGYHSRTSRFFRPCWRKFVVFVTSSLKPAEKP